MSRKNKFKIGRANGSGHPLAPHHDRSKEGKSLLEEQFHQMLAAMGAPAPTPQHQFHPNRRWLFDFAWPDLRIAVEVHGGTFVKGRHVTGKGFWSDRIKMNAALRLNWKVFELVASDLGDARIYQEIIWELEQRAREGVIARSGAPFNQVHPESKSRRQVRADRVLERAARKALAA